MHILLQEPEFCGILRIRKGVEKMKKAGTVLITVLLLAIISTTAANALTDYSGGVTEYTLDEYDISVKAPDNWMSFTWDVEADDENLKTLNTTKEKLLTYFQENRIIYETAYPGKGTIDLSFQNNKETQQIYDLTNLTDSLLQVMGKAMAEGEYKNGDDRYTYSDYDFYYYNETQYIVLNFTSNGDGKNQGVVYYTITEGKEYRFILTAEKGKATDELRNTLKQMVDDTVYFYNEFWDDPNYDNHWDEYVQNYPEEFDKAVGIAGSVGIAIVMAFIIGFFVLAAIIVLIVVLAVKSSSKNKAAAQGFDIRTGPDGRQYYYPHNIGIPQQGGACQPPCPPQAGQPPAQNDDNQENPYDGSEK